MIERFQQFLSSKLLLLPGQRVLAAVSGGVDSMVMLDLFQRSGIDTTVAHVNFGLRGDESDGDEAFIRSYCQSAGIIAHTIRFDTEAIATARGLSIQMAARELRYDWFRQLAEREGLHRIATAHHLNDQAETMVMRLVHGSGLSGLAGIPVSNGAVIRPMLFASRKEIQEYALAHGIQWREDASNAGTDYERNFIRHRVMPALGELNPSLEQTTDRMATKLAGSLEVMAIGLEVLRGKVLRQSDSGEVQVDRLAIGEFRNPSAVLHLLLEDFGFHPEVCSRMVDVPVPVNGSVFHSPTHVLTVDREVFTICPLSEIDHGAKEIVIPGPGCYRLGEMELTCTEADPTVESTSAVACLDHEAVKFPLLWRHWQSGDRFIPLGMEHEKKVSDMLIDLKAPAHGKQQESVILSDGRIIWLTGRRIGHGVRITETTRRMLRLEVKKVTG
ncbi:MAG: tRNA lysidine(34) synthetase TilS [Bacteroidota bacterium]